MIHRLTRRREKDKSAFELHRTLVETIKEVRAAATSGWTARSRAKREAAIQETQWQLQRTGALANLIWRQSRYGAWLLWEHSIFLEKRMATLRDAITLDEFTDPTRKHRPSEVKNVERAVGAFLDGLDIELLGWVDRSNRRLKPQISRLIRRIKLLVSTSKA